MKIVQLCPYAMDRPGGVQRHVRDLATWLTAQGHETRIVAPPAPGAAPRHTGNLTEIGRARAITLHGTAFEVSFAAPWHIARAARDLRNWGADVVHIHTPWTPLLVWQLWRALDLPTVTTVHATLPRIDGKGLHDRYIHRAARHFMTRSSAVITPSAAPLALLRQLAPGTPVRVLPPAVDLADWQAARHPLRPGNTVQMVFLGRLEARKGVAVLLDAWRRIGPGHPQLDLTIAGDGALRSAVEAAIRGDRTGRLHYVERPDDAAARRLVAGADLFLAPAPYGESFGIVLAEAMAAGAVPIAAANDGYASVLTGPGVEALVAPGNAEALADKIVMLARDPGKRHALRDWGEVHARQFGISTAGPAYLELYTASRR